MDAKRSLTQYLQGHDAAGTAAVQTVKLQAEAQRGTPLGSLLARMGEEIAQDKASLREVMALLEVTPSRLKGAAALVAAAFGRWTLRAHFPGEPQARLIGLESLSLGIEGKARLWRALRELASGDPRLGDVDFDNLTRRAEHQREDLEPYRLDAARDAHGKAASPR
jgi:hypothetical protein